MNASTATLAQASHGPRTRTLPQAVAHSVSARLTTTGAAAQLLSLGFATIGVRATLAAIAGQFLSEARTA